MAKRLGDGTCWYGGCKGPVTHTVERLWKVGGKTLPILDCCAAHASPKPATDFPLPSLGRPMYRYAPKV